MSMLPNLDAGKFSIPGNLFEIVEVEDGQLKQQAHRQRLLAVYEAVAARLKKGERGNLTAMIHEELRKL